MIKKYIKNFAFKAITFGKTALKKTQMLVYPSTCPLCGVVVLSACDVCEECRGKICYVEYPACLKCGKEVASKEIEFCADCKEHSRTFVKGFPVMKYMEPVDGSIAAFKYNNKRKYAKFFAREIVKRRGREILDVGPEVIVPVPVHKSKLKKRGYNQAELLANELSEYFFIPVDTELIERKINTLPQKNLDDEQREQNLKKAFISTDKIVKYKSALLVDDIYTTGSTIEACAKILQSQGIANVYYTSICIGIGER